MTENGKSDSRSAQERADELMERVVSDGARIISRFAGRVREEVEDIIAEARTRNEGSRAGTRG